MELILRLDWKPWDWEGISRNPSITMEDAKNNPDKPWSFLGLSCNTNLTSDMFFKHFPRRDWDYNFVSQNPMINMDVLLQLPLLGRLPFMGWDWTALSQNPSITMEDIQNNPQLPWEWEAIFRNPNLTMDMVQSRHLSSDWNCWVSIGQHNKFVREKATYITTRIPELTGLSLLSMMEEDYDRHDGVFESNNPNLLVLQNEYLVSTILNYIILYEVEVEV